MGPRLASFLCAAALLTGCGGGVVIGGVSGFDCEGEKVIVTQQHGLPDEVDRRIDGGLHIDTFLFFGSGLAISFTFGGDIACVRQDGRFDPVTRSITPFR